MAHPKLKTSAETFFNGKTLLLLVLSLTALLASLQGKAMADPGIPGETISIKESAKGLEPETLLWKLGADDEYHCSRMSIPLDSVQRIRTIIVESEHQERFPVFTFGPSLAKAQARRPHTQEFGNLSLEVDLGGEPRIVAKCQNTRPIWARDDPTPESLPIWEIRVGDRQWETSRLEIATALGPLCLTESDLTRQAFHNLERWYVGPQSDFARAVQNWAAFTEIDRELKLIEAENYQIAVNCEFRVRKPGVFTHVRWASSVKRSDDNLYQFVGEETADRYITLAKRHGYYFATPEGPKPDWTPLLLEFHQAEEMIDTLPWVQRLSDGGVLKRIEMRRIEGLNMKHWPLKSDPDIQLEITDTWGYSSDILIDLESHLAFSPGLSPVLSFALPVPGYTGPKPETMDDGTPIIFTNAVRARTLIHPDGSAELLE